MASLSFAAVFGRALRVFALVSVVVPSACSSSDAEDAPSGPILCATDGANSELTTTGGRVRMLGTARWDQVPTFLPQGPKGDGAPSFEYDPQIAMNLEVNVPGCLYKVSLFVTAPTAGAVAYRDLPTNHQPSFWGMFTGTSTSDRLDPASTLEITSVSETEVSGRFQLVLKDGTKLSGGRYDGVLISGRKPVF